MVLASLCNIAAAQSDTTKPAVATDTIRVGNIIIIKGGEKNKGSKDNGNYIRVERKTDSKYQFGQEVNVKRKSGEIEPSWKVDEVLPDGKIIVSGTEKTTGVLIEKTVTPEDLDAWQVQALESSNNEKYKFGTHVTVKRSDGRYETNWRVGPRLPDGRLTVLSTDPASGLVISKPVTSEVLDSWQLKRQN